ncbi:hypothetical protein E2I00_001916, partial [Balaenoptera physalus]
EKSGLLEISEDSGDRASREPNVLNAPEAVAGKLKASVHGPTPTPSSTPDYLTEAERMKRSNLRRSASHDYVPGTPVYREKEDMYDEIIELKKSLHMQKSNVDLMRTKLRRLEEENSRKDRQIEQLLDPSRGPDFVRTLAEKRPDTGWVVSGLKQRILKLEQRFIGSRLSWQVLKRQERTEKKIGLKRQKKMSSALLSLSRSVQELTEENQSLKEDLDRVLSSSPTASKIKGSVEWSKPRLLRRIAELEKVVGSTPPAHSASSSTVHRQPRPDHQEESERLRGVVKRLKGERSALHTQLQERDLEVKQLLQTKADLEKELENMKEGRKFRHLPGSFKNWKKARKERRRIPRKRTRNAPRPPGPSQTDSELDTSEGGSSRPRSGCSEGRRDAAARLLQCRWKGHQHRKKKAVRDESTGMFLAVGGCRAAGGFPGASGTGEAIVYRSVQPGHPCRAKPSHPSNPQGLHMGPSPNVLFPFLPTLRRRDERRRLWVLASCLALGVCLSLQPLAPVAPPGAAGPRAATAALPDRPAWAPQSAPCSPPFPADSPGRQRGEQRGDRGGSGSRGRSAEAMGARGAGSPAALLCGALSLGAAARGDSARGGRELRRLRRDRRGSASAHEEHRLPALGPCGRPAHGDALSGQG